MPVWNILRYTISLLLLCSCLSAAAQDTATAQPKKRKPVAAAGRQLRINIDLSKPVLNAFNSGTQNYELSVDYYFKKEVYFVAEGGFGHAAIDYTDLKYRTNSAFIRLGADKSMLQRLFPGDWDMAFIGARYGFSTIRRSEATYAISDSLWGPSGGTVAARNFTAHWAEVVGGIRVELYKGLTAGWNVRAKFMLNASAFQDLAPAYISGYGKGDKSTAFDFNFYLSYAMRWGNKKSTADRSGALK